MLPAIYEFVFTRPRLARALGEGLCWLGTTGLLAGFLARSINGILEVSSLMGGRSAPVNFSQLFSPLSTWWVPESFLAVLLYSSLIAIGYVLLESSRRLHKLTSHC